MALENEHVHFLPSFFFASSFFVILFRIAATP